MSLFHCDPELPVAYQGERYSRQEDMGFLSSMSVNLDGQQYAFLFINHKLRF
jgi:hypothetical protein